ncbi:protein of unknown function [Singulisphaera sp. GP187]|uniref:3-keto-disaccharide hydrolase n=1 Tax=Singulisphaera sp. GP187 TaxID=1882752 RepID=UPI00092CC02A|nr:DUF1080 domain-containing protein [Singulisphaera sp. GP187]SIO62888.1 protein of unknown function [Singulisphaera sp. GP187]
MTRLRLTLAGVALTVVWVAMSLADEPASVALFDGKTLTGWTLEHTQRFAVRDGVIVNDGGTGWLRSDKRYKNFELEAEYRAVNKGADSGIFFRTATESSPEEPHWPARGYQLQVSDSENNFKVFGHGTPPPTSDRHSAELKQAMKGAGEWQQIRLKVVGTRVEASLNGVPVTASDAIALPEGHIGLQAEHGHFEWRSLKIKELPAS